jgi:hypothetical protein
MGILSNWNYMKQIEAYPCASPNPLIYITTFAPAVTPALVDFISWGCRDIVKFKAGIGQPCGRLFKAQAVKAFGPAAVDMAHNILKFTRPVEFGLFWWFVADLASDSLARWDSLAYQMSGCDLPNDTASWQLEWIPQGAMSANVPKPIVGQVTHESGRPGFSASFGAVVPPGYYWQGSFTVKAHPIFSLQHSNLSVWIRTENTHGFDYSANQYPPGYPGAQKSGTYTMNGRARADRPTTFVKMYAMTDQLSIIDDVQGNFTVSRLPILDWTLSPLSCFRDTSGTRVENPAHRNKRADFPTRLDPADRGPGFGPTRRGPPGGKPRSKG